MKIPASEIEAMRDEIDIEAAERGIDRDHSENELEEWKEKRLAELIAEYERKANHGFLVKEIPFTP